jgi:hypothetical protein
LIEVFSSPFIVLFSVQKPALPPPSVYNDDYFADVKPTNDKGDKKGAKVANGKDKGKKEKKKNDDKSTKRRSSGTLRDLFGKDGGKEKPVVEVPPRRLSGSGVKIDSIAPVPIAAKGPVADTGKKALPVSVGAVSTAGPAPQLAKFRSEGDGTHIRQLVVKLESDRKMIQVGQPKGVAVERKYMGLSLTELRFLFFVFFFKQILSFVCSTRDGRLVPLIVSDCIKWLWQNGTKDGGLFIMEAPVEKVSALTQRIEKGLYSSMYE